MRAVSRPVQTIVTAVLGLTTLATFGRGEASAQAAGSSELVAAAQAFIDTLDPAERQRALREFDDEERFNFHFIPREREGLPLKAMSLPQRRAAHALMKQVLSTQGYLKATSIMALESVLAEIDDNPVMRDAENYYFTIFGPPTAGGVWGWRLEGHHLSLNFAAASGELAVTPAFWGSNPAEVRIPPGTGLRVLGSEEDLGRAILTALTDVQRDKAVIAETAAGGIVTGADREARLEGFEGVPVADLSPEQREHVMALLGEVAHNLEQEFARAQMERMLATGLEGFYFAWAGPATHGAGHYYRLHSPTTLIEYDNTQSDANHVHFVWRDLENDFGVDLLRQHYEGSAPDHGHDH